MNQAAQESRTIPSRRQAKKQLFRAARNYRLEAQRALRAGKTPERSKKAGNLARRLKEAAASWQDAAKGRATADGRKPESTPRHGPWAREDRAEVRLLKAAHEYAWARQAGWRREAASRRLLNAALALELVSHPRPATAPKKGDTAAAVKGRE